MAAGATEPWGYAYVWEYRVKPEHVEEFRRAYGPDGDWVRLFRKASGYLGTDLLGDREDPRRFVTVDRWQTYADWAAFRSRLGPEFEELDRRCAELTLEERELGTFEPVTSS